MNGRDLALTALAALLVATEISARAGNRHAGSWAVDPRKRRADLYRVAAPGSGASASERATAQRQLAKMGPDPGPTRPTSTFHHAGHSARPQVPPWQTDPRSQSDIFEHSFRDLNFTKKAIYEHANAPRTRVWLHAFDGSYGRSALDVFTSEDDLDFAGKAFETWSDPFFKTNGHVEAVIAMHAESSHLSQIVRIRGVDVSNANKGKGIWIEDDSFNRNPFNDTSFARRLRDAIEAYVEPS